MSTFYQEVAPLPERVMEDGGTVALKAVIACERALIKPTITAVRTRTSRASTEKLRELGNAGFLEEIHLGEGWRWFQSTALGRKTLEDTLTSG